MCEKLTSQKRGPYKSTAGIKQNSIVPNNKSKPETVKGSGNEVGFYLPPRALRGSQDRTIAGRRMESLQLRSFRNIDIAVVITCKYRGLRTIHVPAGNKKKTTVWCDVLCWRSISPFSLIQQGCRGYGNSHGNIHGYGHGT